MHKYKVGDTVKILECDLIPGFVGKTAKITKTLGIGTKPLYNLDIADCLIFCEDTLIKLFTNFEYYAEKIKEITKQGCNFGVTKDGEIRCCQNMLCSNCIFGGNSFQCTVLRTKWLYENVKQEKEIVLSEAERKLLEILPEKYKYIARDRSGTLYAYIEEPCKNGISPAWTSRGELNDCFKLSQFELPFAFVEWEDDAPYLISDLLSLPKAK